MEIPYPFCQFLPEYRLVFRKKKNSVEICQQRTLFGLQTVAGRPKIPIVPFVSCIPTHMLRKNAAFMTPN